ncbi:MAG: HAD family hydrolase [Planctomycetota bacterium]|nr:HAD family hydrolase [Planctomycetota bacterium]
MGQPAVFLDRDGTLIEEIGYPTRPQQIRILGGVARGLARLAEAGFKRIVVTNQSGIARGLMTEDDLDRFHEALDEQLDLLGAAVDAYYVCPHHPDRSEAARPDLAIECDCRKPKPGLILQAAEDLDIDLGASWAIGDTWRDVQAGQAASLKTIKLPAPPGHDAPRPADVPPPTAEAEDFEDAVRIILGDREAVPPEAAEAQAPPAHDQPPPSAREEPWPEDTEAPAPQEETAAESPLPVWPHFVAKGQDFPQNHGVARPVLPGRASAHGGTRPAVPHADLKAASTPPDAALKATEERRPAAPADAAVCARCGQKIPSTALASGAAGPRAGRLLCAECLAHQPPDVDEVAAARTGETGTLLYAMLKELRRMGRIQSPESLPLVRLFAYVIQAVAIFAAVWGLLNQDRPGFIQAAVFLQLVVVTLLVLERKS